MRWIGAPDADEPAAQVKVAAEPGAPAVAAAQPAAPASDAAQSGDDGGGSDGLAIAALIVGALRCSPPGPRPSSA